METYRSVLEVLKLSSPRDVLQLTSTSTLWRRVGECQELWLSLSDLLGLQPCLDSIAFRVKFRAGYCLAETEGRLTRVYNCLSGSWRFVSHEKTPFSQASACTWLPSGEILVCGGYGPCTSQAALIDVRTGEIRELPPMQTARGMHCVVAYGQCAYVFSGYCGVIVRNCEKLDLSVSNWSQLPDTPDGAVNSGACVYDTSIYQCGTEFNTLLAFRIPTERFESTGVRIQSQGAVRSCIRVEDEVVILCLEEMKQWKEGSLLSQQRVKTLCGDWWGSMNPLYVQGKVYVLSERGLLQVFSLDTQQCHVEDIPRAF